MYSPFAPRLPRALHFGGAPAAPPPQAPDTSYVQAQQEKEAQEAATKERVRRAQMGGTESLLNKSTGWLGVQNQTLGSS